MCQAQKEPEKLRERKQREKERILRIEVVKEATNELLDNGSAVASCKQVQEKVVDDYDMRVGSKLVNYVMRKEMNLVYRMTKKVAPRANSERCLVLR